MNSTNDLRTVVFPNNFAETNALLCYPPRTSIDDLHLFDCLVMLVRVVYAEGVVKNPQYRELVDKLANACPLMKLAWKDFRVDDACEERASVAKSLMDNSTDAKGPWGHLRSMFYHDSLLPLRESPFLKLFPEGQEEALDLDCTAGNKSLCDLVRRAFLVKDEATGQEVGRFTELEPLFLNVWYRPNKDAPLSFSDLQVMEVPFNREWDSRSMNRYALRVCISCTVDHEAVRVFSFNFSTVRFKHESDIDGRLLRFDGGLCDAYLLAYVLVGDFEVEKRTKDVEVEPLKETLQLIDSASQALRALVTGEGDNTAVPESRPEELLRPMEGNSSELATATVLPGPPPNAPTGPRGDTS